MSAARPSPPYAPPPENCWRASTSHCPSSVNDRIGKKGRPGATPVPGSIGAARTAAPPGRRPIGRRSVLVLVLERELEFGAERDSAVLVEVDVLLDNFSHPEITDRRSGRLDRLRGRVLPGCAAGPDDLDHLVHAHLLLLPGRRRPPGRGHPASISILPSPPADDPTSRRTTAASRRRASAPEPSRAGRDDSRRSGAPGRSPTRAAGPG